MKRGLAGVRRLRFQICSMCKQKVHNIVIVVLDSDV
jgi:hypothetical protein